MSEIVRELRYQGDGYMRVFGSSVAEQFIGHTNDLTRAVGDWLHTIDAQRTTRQVAPFHPLTLFGWAPTLRGRWM